MLAPLKRLGGRVLIALDGTEYHCSRKVHCARCSTRKRADGGTEYFHTFQGASIVAQDGAEKQDCEYRAVKRWLAQHASTLAATSF